jgi:hypothetical protein
MSLTWRFLLTGPVCRQPRWCSRPDTILRKWTAVRVGISIRPVDGLGLQTLSCGPLRAIQLRVCKRLRS